jgi:hypothetical protein
LRRALCAGIGVVDRRAVAMHRGNHAARKQLGLESPVAESSVTSAFLLEFLIVGTMKRLFWVVLGLAARK